MPDVRTLVGTALLSLAMGLLPAGCATTTGKAEVTMVGAAGARNELTARFQIAAYVVTPIETSIYLSDVPLEALLDPAVDTAQVVHIEILWRAVPGQTPVENEATNASIRHVILVEGQVGIYGGAGFVSVSGKTGAKRLRISTEGATMALLDATEGFEDLLSPAEYEGDVVAINDEAMALRIRQAVAQRVTDAFGAPRFVEGGQAPAHAKGGFERSARYSTRWMLRALPDPSSMTTTAPHIASPPSPIS